MKTKVLTVASHDFAVPLQPFFNTGSISTFMLNETFRPNVKDMFPRSSVEFVIPFELAYWSQSFEVLDCFLNG